MKRSTLTLTILLFGWSALSNGRVSVSPDGQFLATANDKIAGVISLTADTAVFKVRVNNDVIGSGFSQDAKVVVFQDAKYTFYAYDMEGNELWQSELAEVVNIPKELNQNFIAFSQSGNYIIQLQRTDALILDRWSGELIGFHRFKDAGSSPTPPRSWEGDSFEFGTSLSKSHFKHRLTVVGYGELEVKEIHSRFSEYVYKLYQGDYFKGQSVYGKEMDSDDNWEFYTAGGQKPFLKYRASFTGPNAKVLFSENGSTFFFMHSNDGYIFDYEKGKKKKAFSTNAGIPVFLNDQILVTRSANDQRYYKIYDANTGKEIKSGDATVDLKYEGTSVARTYLKEAGVLFFDDFDDNQNEWGVGETDVSKKSIENGQFIMSTKDGSTSATWCNKISIDPFRDFEIEVKVKAESTDESKSFGFFWGRNRHHRFYQGLKFKSSGQLWVGRYLHKKFRNDFPYTAVEAFQKSDFNVFKVKKEGPMISFFVNDMKFYEEPFRGFFGNKVGFLYRNTMIVDYIKVSYLSAAYQDKIPIYMEDFDDNDSNWAAGNKEGKYEQSVVNGYYRYATLSDNSYYKTNNLFYIDEDQSYELEVSMRYESSSNDKLSGIMWGRQADGSNRYRFGIGPGGSARIDYYKDGSWYKIHDWSKDIKIDASKFVKLKIQKTRGRYKFYINDELLEKKGFRYNNDLEYSFGPKIGFHIAGNSAINVDYIRASYINHRSVGSGVVDGKRIYLPYMRWDNPANSYKKVLVGNPIYCNKWPKTKQGGMGLATTTREVSFRVIPVDDKDEIDWAKRQIIDQHGNGNGYMNWTNSPGCN